MSDTPEVHELVRRAREGDRAAQSALYERCAEEVFTVLRRLTGDEDVAADLAQDTWLRAFARIGQFRMAGPFCAWVYKMARRIALDHLKSKYVRDREPLEPGIADGAPPLDLALDRVVLERCLDTLPVGYRTVLLLRIVDGLDHREIADQLGVTPVTSRTQFHKARARMARCLEAG